jgi:hypothetical protein
MISPNKLTREIVDEHRRWLLNNVGNTHEVSACRQYFDKRLGARRKIAAKECICASINRRRHADTAKREAAQINATATRKPILDTPLTGTAPVTIAPRPTVEVMREAPPRRENEMLDLSDERLAVIRGGGSASVDRVVKDMFAMATELQRHRATLKRLEELALSLEHSWHPEWRDAAVLLRNRMKGG